MDNFERKEHFSQVEEKKIEDEIKLKIPNEEWEILQLIIEIIGGDFRVEIKLGKPGEGSFFNPEDCSITIDPLHLQENPKLAKFVVSHEASHRAISPQPKELGLTPGQVRELYSQIGFGYLQNVIEDPVVNDWMRKKFPGLDECVKEIYDELLKEEGVVLSTPEIRKIAIQLGYWPKFSHFGSEIIRHWHQRRFSQKLDPAVQKALERTIKYAEESIRTIPDPEKRDKKEIISKAQRRFDINTNDIWPEVNKLVEMDLRIEEQRQMLNEFRQKLKELGQKKQELKNAQSAGDLQKQKELEKEIGGLEKELDPFNQLPENVKKELQEQIDKAIREAVEQLNKEIENKQKQIKEAKQKQEELEKEIQDLEEKVKSASGEEKEEIEKQLQEKRAEKLAQKMKERQAQKELKQNQDTLKQIQSGKEMPYPEDKLSEKTKQELDKLLKELPQAKQKELKKKAQEKLEDFEDVINKEMENKLNKERPESHQKRKECEKISEESAKKSEEAKLERERIEKELERIRKESMTPYERARAEVVGLIDSLYYSLWRILKPEEWGGEETSYPSGKILDINRAMQAEKDIEQKYKLWKRETAPEKKDYRFWHLVDLSGSMSGEKIKETFKGFIIAGEAIDRLEDLNSTTITIHQGITGFHSEIFPYKEPNERFTKNVENKLSTMLARTEDSDAGTNTYSATLFALEALKQNRGETANFLLTFSDGQPDYIIRDSLKALLKKNKKEREKLKIKVGLIWLGEEEDEQELKEMLDEYVEEYGYDFGLVMPVVKPKKGKTFSELLTDLLEDIVKNPEKY